MFQRAPPRRGKELRHQICQVVTMHIFLLPAYFTGALRRSGRNGHPLSRPQTRNILSPRRARDVYRPSERLWNYAFRLGRIDR